eukprot:NODE_1196_length_1841_cov_0.324914.p1 type:complete len:133 gc:universal NODE_1196_length_1841_cov_0.324914:835-437(-)
MVLIRFMDKVEMIWGQNSSHTMNKKKFQRIDKFERREIIIWSWISYWKKGPLIVCEGHMEFKFYTKMINRHFKPNLLSLEDEYGDFFVVHDNAPIHTSKHTTEYLEEFDMTFIDWPAKSPDMNVIELMWREL